MVRQNAVCRLKRILKNTWLNVYVCLSSMLFCVICIFLCCRRKSSRPKWRRARNCRTISECRNVCDDASVWITGWGRRSGVVNVVLKCPFRSRGFLLLLLFVFVLRCPKILKLAINSKVRFIPNRWCCLYIINVYDIEFFRLLWQANTSSAYHACTPATGE